MIRVEIKTSASRAVSGILFNETSQPKPTREFESKEDAENWLNQCNQNTNKTPYLQPVNDYDSSKADYYVNAQ